MTVQQNFKQCSTKRKCEHFVTWPHPNQSKVELALKNCKVLKIYNHAQAHLSFANGNKIEVIGQVTWGLKLGTLKVRHTFTVCKYLTWYLILVLDTTTSSELVQIEMKIKVLFLHRNGRFVICAHQIQFWTSSYQNTRKFDIIQLL